jgi:signal transduction histidine kinase
MKIAGLLKIINLGVKPTDEIAEQRRIKNTNLLSIIASLIAFVVAIFYYFLGMNLLGSLVLFMICYFALNIFWTSKGFNKPARNFSLIMTNLILFFGASVMGSDAGVVFIYFPLICLGIFYFGSNEKRYTAFFLLFSFFMIQLLELTDYSLFNSYYKFNNASKSLYVLHMNIGLFLTCFFVFYVFINFQESEDVLTKSRHTLHTIFNHSSDAIFIVNLENLLIEDCNKESLKMFEADDLNSLLHTRCTYLLKDAYKKDDMIDILNEVRTDIEWEKELELISKKGKIFWGNMSIKYFIIDKKELLHLRITDITERKKNLDKLKATHNELETFMYKSSHNLKGPSASILGLIDLAKTEINDPVSLKYLEMIEISSKRLDSTLVDLLNITRIKQGGIIFSNVEPKKIFQEVIEDMQFYPGYDQIKIKTFIENVEVIQSDRNILKSILHNLLENAIKYRDPSKDSFVNISITGIGENLRIEVIDNGIGIPSQYKDKIFNMFFRAHNIAHGTGLGLYIVHNSVEKLSGNITMESIEGKGTTFIINLPKYLRQNVS